MAENEMSRRDAMKAAGVAGVGLAMAGCVPKDEKGKCGCGTKKLVFDNSSFYDKDGKFIVDKGKDAYISLMKYHGFQVFPGIKEKLWVSDYGTGEFTSLGLGANCYLNIDTPNKGERYMLMDLFLLPNQMLPEHYHLETEKALPKRESWLVRHGSSYIIGKGDPTEGIKEKMPESQRASATVFHAQLTNPGENVEMTGATDRHSQIGGPEGCIMTEVANFHDNDGVRHTNPKLVFP